MVKLSTMDGSPQVVSAVRARIEEQGAISFEELMALSLYHPKGGLYRIRVPSLGREAHYTTCARIDSTMGLAIARWLEAGWRQALGAPLRWHVIEVGGGDGSLAEAVLNALPKRLRWTVTYHMVEKSEPAIALQRERLGRYVQWNPTVVAALRQCRGAALMLSNELVDAFPAVALVRRGGRWMEVWLVERDGLLIEELRDPGSWLDEPGVYSVAELETAPEGARAEVHRSYHEWVGSWTPLFRKGWILTIDYGDECSHLYGRGGGGTLRAYFSNIRIQEHEDLYRRLGLQDITCDVNFTDLIRWSERDGCSAELLTQRDLLARCGVDLSEETSSPALEFISRPGGAGTSFRALWQRRVGFPT